MVYSCMAYFYDQFWSLTVIIHNWFQSSNNSLGRALLIAYTYLWLQKNKNKKNNKLCLWRGLLYWNDMALSEHSICTRFHSSSVVFIEFGFVFQGRTWLYNGNTLNFIYNFAYSRTVFLHKICMFSRRDPDSSKGWHAKVDMLFYSNY